MTTNFEKIKYYNIEELTHFLVNFLINNMARNAVRCGAAIDVDVQDAYNTTINWLRREAGK